MKGISCFVGVAVALVCSVADVRGTNPLNIEKAISQIKNLQGNYKAFNEVLKENEENEKINILNISYGNLVKYANEKNKAFFNGIERINDPKRKDTVKKYLKNIGLDKEAFKKAVIPNNENSNNTFFRIDKNGLLGDEKAKTTQINFIKTMLSEIIDNPVGEARIKSLMLLYCLQQAGLLVGANWGLLLEGMPGVCDDHIEVKVAELAMDGDPDGFEILLDNSLTFYVHNFLPGLSPVLYIGNKDEVKNGYDPYLISTDKDSLDKILDKTSDDSKYVRQFLAVSYIHELGHAYHKAIGIGAERGKEPQKYVMLGNEEPVKKILKYVVPLLNESVFDDVKKNVGENLAEERKTEELNGTCGKKDPGFWDDWDEMLATFGIGFYPDGKKVYIVEDRINENAARHYCGLSYQIGHNRNGYNEDINDAMNDEKNGYKQMVKEYYESREIDDIKSCNKELRKLNKLLFDEVSCCCIF